MVATLNFAIRIYNSFVTSYRDTVSFGFTSIRLGCHSFVPDYADVAEKLSVSMGGVVLLGVVEWLSSMTCFWHT